MFLFFINKIFMITHIKKGFTLIELLVVITIIGILATGATSVYTSQIQKARDTTRVSDVKALQSAIEQYYQDKSYYPATTVAELASSWWILQYISKLPRDPKSWEPCANAATTQPQCWYAYNTSNDDNGLELWAYELSTAFENKWNITSKAKTDKLGWWNSDDNRLEIWIPTATWIDTELVVDSAKACQNKSWVFSSASKKCTGTAISGTSAAGLVMIAWN